MHLEDVEVGQDIPSLGKGPMSSAHIFRWSASIELLHRIHYDQAFARAHDGLPNVLVNGSWKQHVLIQLLTDWAGADGWLWKLKFQYRGMNVAGDTLEAWGRVEEKIDHDGFGVVRLAIGLRDQNASEGTPGTADVVFPKRGCPALPYPFDPLKIGLPP